VLSPWPSFPDERAGIVEGGRKKAGPLARERETLFSEEAAMLVKTLVPARAAPRRVVVNLQGGALGGRR